MRPSSLTLGLMALAQIELLHQHHQPYSDGPDFGYDPKREPRLAFERQQKREREARLAKHAQTIMAQAEAKRARKAQKRSTK